MHVNRRDFIKLTFCSSAYLLVRDLTQLYAASALKEVLYYKKLGKNTVQCLNCPHKCQIGEGKRGFCRVRENQGGRLFNIVYSMPCAVHIDPIEKKPLFHVLPGSKTFSIATAGCNLRCKFCQNWQISQAKPEEVNSVTLSPKEIAEQAKKTDCLSIAYTYTEPTAFYEYALDSAIEAKKLGIKNTMHSNGFINPEPLSNICPHLTAINVDLKGFTDKYYQDICSGRLQNVLDSLILIKKKGVWLELTNLIIPALNDKPEEIKQMCEWIVKSLGPEVPIHFSRFFPMYKLTTLPPTPPATLETARKIAVAAGLHFAYIGNIPGHPAENTYCPNCSSIVVKRSGYSILNIELENGRCKNCNEPIPGVWS